jgi:GTPase Era involved in 16S rRNA processing
VVGDTGVGKSTILNYLAGNKLMVKSDGLKPKLITEGTSIIKIGHDKYS